MVHLQCFLQQHTLQSSCLQTIFCFIGTYTTTKVRAASYNSTWTQSSLCWEPSTHSHIFIYTQPHLRPTPTLLHPLQTMECYRIVCCPQQLPLHSTFYTWVYRVLHPHQHLLLPTGGSQITSWGLYLLTCHLSASYILNSTFYKFQKIVVCCLYGQFSLLCIYSFSRIPQIQVRRLQAFYVLQIHLSEKKCVCVNRLKFGPAVKQFQNLLLLLPVCQWTVHF